MDLGLSEEQEMLKNFARDFLEKECPEKLVREMEEDERGYTDALWQGMAGQGWQGLIIDEEHGGTGMTFLDLCVLLEEFGRALVPGPFINTVLSTGLVQAIGSDEQKSEILPKVASGELIMTLAFTEPSARFDVDGVDTTATKDGEDYVLSGTKLFIPDAHVSDQLIVVAREPGSVGEDGISLFLVDGKADGVTCTVLKTIAADKQCEVKLENVNVPASALLGPEGQGWGVMHAAKRYWTVAYCAYLVGLAQRDFEISVDYARERIQFGRPIGSFQAIPAQGRRHGDRRRRLPLHHVPRRLGRERRGRRCRPASQHGQSLVLGRHPWRRRPRPADPRRHRLHQGIHHSALLPAPENGRADVGRRRLPSREGRPAPRDLRPP